MTRKEIIEEVSIQTGVSMRATMVVYDAIFAEIYDALVRGETIRVDNLFIMEPYIQRSKRIKDVNTGEMKMTKPCRRVRCKISKKLKEAIKMRERESADYEDY